MIIDVVVASTSRFQKFGQVRSPAEAEDLSGEAILEKIKAAGHAASYTLLPDGFVLRSAVEKSDADAIVICGGTGLTHTDLTIEAIEPLFEKTLPPSGGASRAGDVLPSPKILYPDMAQSGP